jgi:hypothetical protein
MEGKSEVYVAYCPECHDYILIAPHERIAKIAAEEHAEQTHHTVIIQLSLAMRYTRSGSRDSFNRQYDYGGTRFSLVVGVGGFEPSTSWSPSKV